MLDVHEYLLSMRERDKTILELASSINEVFACMNGNISENNLSQALAKMNALREAYANLSRHSTTLLSK